MQEDILDIVDEKDRIVGQLSRSLLHARGLRHRAVHVIVCNADGEIFVQKRSQSKDTWPGAWDSSCSGHVDAGESYGAAALRELEEELGWRPEEPLERLFKLDPCEQTGMEFVEVYRVYGDGPFRLNLEEIEIGEWMSAPNLLERIEYTPNRFSSAFRLIVSHLRARGLLPQPKRQAW